MFDPTFYIIMAMSSLIGLAMLSAVGLVAWRGWLSLKHQQLSAGIGPRHENTGNTAGARIEVADLKERIRKLEAIAAGVDL